MKRIGLDIGSTTLKCVVIDEENKIQYHTYVRHRSRIAETAAETLSEVSEKFSDETMTIAISGSAGMGIAEQLHVPFVQEVYATKIAVQLFWPQADVVIELGGEDAKIIFLTNGFEMRMNGTCAGGTGAFIDQMAELMNLTAEELNDLAAQHQRTFMIASRCGVFAKSDIQPLLNQGAQKEDIAASILYAVVNQTVAGLAQGRKITGQVLYLGGPLTFFSELRKSFDDVLKICGICPENSLYYVALGAALSGVGKADTPSELKTHFSSMSAKLSYQSCKPLFENEEEYQKFCTRHEKASQAFSEIEEPSGEMCLGIDAGSTTIKAVLCDEAGHILRPFYHRNKGNPVPLVKEYLEAIYRDFPEISIRACAVTGYGEELVKNAFYAEFGLVETVAHYTAAKRFLSNVDFIIDIGGQDIKCFRIRNHAIDNIYLNEACSSGCGSFLQTFAGALGYTVQEFSKLGLFATAPVDLGSRCTVFMNSSVKQAQKDGATAQDISAGLSISVVKNALYKVIRCPNPEMLGQNIVVQGGTFLNDAVLRAFEQEIGREVIRPAYAGMMGALGAAFYAWENSKPGDRSKILKMDELARFQHKTSSFVCSGCNNHCRLTRNDFGDGRKYIAGNRCDKPLGGTGEEKTANLVAYKTELLAQYRGNVREKGKKTIGIPMGLNLYELLPFWYTFFHELGFNVLVSPPSSRELYLKGQHTIPSDTVCYPAKLIHGHIEALLAEKPDAIFYPDMSYNLDEQMGTNHYNCPVVAYYPQVLGINVPELQQVSYINDFISLANPKEFSPHIEKILRKYFGEISSKAVRKAAASAYAEYHRYFARVRQRAQEYLEAARKKGQPIIVLAGRPYHIDPEISHGISSLICRMGAVVLTEDSISHLAKPFASTVMNQWTYHARLYAAAHVVADSPEAWNLNLVQLVSFGCGVDAVTTDEVKEILEERGKLYTQIKIDEISNMGAITIRLRSLFSALEERKKKNEDGSARGGSSFCR